MSDLQSGRTVASGPYADQHPPYRTVSTFSDAVSAFFSKYATFSGRANRPEFWYSMLFLTIVYFMTTIADRFLIGGDFSPLTSIAQLAFLIPSLSITARRLHDIDRTGWWMLLGLIPIIGWIVLVVFNCQRGTAGANRFG